MSLQMPASMLEMPAAMAVAAASMLQPMLQLAAIPIPATVPAATAGHIAVIAKVIPAWQKVCFLCHIVDSITEITAFYRKCNCLFCFRK